MSDGPFYPYLGLLVLSGALLVVMGAAGFGQARTARIADVVAGAGFLGYAAFLWIDNPGTIRVFFYAFAVPALAVINIIRSRRHRRGAAVPALPGYAHPGATAHGGFTPQQPAGGFPPAPVFAPAHSPGDSPAAAALFAAPKQPVPPQAPAVDPGAYGAMPSGLAGHDHHEQALPSARPSGLPGRVPAHAAPVSTFAGGPSEAGPPDAGPSYEPAMGARSDPAHVEFTQRLLTPEPAAVRDEPAGPQPLYPAYPGPVGRQGRPADPARPQGYHDAAAQDVGQPHAVAPWPVNQAPAAHPGPTMARHAEPEPRFRHSTAQYFEQARAGHADYRSAVHQQGGRHAYHYGDAAEGRHERPKPEVSEQPGHHATHDLDDEAYARGPEAFGQPSHRPTHDLDDEAYPRQPEAFGQPSQRATHDLDDEAYRQEPAAHPADWPPRPR
jgi:hypothetical protein